MYDDQSSVPAAPVDILPQGMAASRRPAWMAVAAATVAVLSVLSAVAFVVLGGSSGSVADAATIVHATSQRAASVGSSKVAIDMTMSVEGRTVTATGGGAFDYRHRTGFMSMTMDGLGELQEVLTRKAIYLRMPDGVSQAMGSSRPWIEMRFSAMKAAGVDMSKLMSANPSGDPTSMLRILSKADVVHRDGSEDVNGVHTTRYSVTSSMLDLLRAEGLSSAVDVTKLPPGLADSKLHVDVSVDDTGLPRRMRMSMDMPGGGSMTMTMNLFDFGKPVHVTVPPREVVTDITRLAR